MTNPNLFICPSCKIGLISEEVSTHKCMIITDYWVINGIIWLGDGKRYYPLKRPPSTDRKHDKDYRQGNRTCLKVLYN